MGELIGLHREGEEDRFAALERVCALLPRSVTALAQSAWLIYAWPVERERDEVADRLWRAWRELGAAHYEGMQWVMEAAGHAEEQAWELGLSPSPRWVGQVAACLVWLWRVSVERGEGVERGSIEVLDGVELPERFAPAAPRRRGANDIAAARLVLAAGQIELTACDDHEAGYWVARASLMPRRAMGMGFDGESCARLLYAARA